MQWRYSPWLQLAACALLLIGECSARMLSSSREARSHQSSAAGWNPPGASLPKGLHETHRSLLSRQPMAKAVPTDDSMPQDTLRSVVRRSRVTTDREEALRKAKKGDKSAAEGSERRLQGKGPGAVKLSQQDEDQVPAIRPAGKQKDGAAEEEEAELELTEESEEVWVEEISGKGEPALQPKAAVAQGKASLRTDNAADSLVQASSAGGDNDPASSRAGGQKAGSRTALSPGQASTVGAAHDTAREPVMLSGPGSQAILIRNARKRSLEEAKLPAERKLPPWFRDYLDDSGERPRPKLGAARAHKMRVLSGEERWMHEHQRHLSVIDQGWDVIFYGDDLVEAWRGTFQGQAYGPFADIPAVWDAFFGAQSYTVLAAGIAGDGVEQLKWRLENGELPPHVRPEVIVLAIGTNSKGLVGECRLAWAEENAAVMTALLRELRKGLPRTRIVLLAPLPKGEYWPNRCTPAFQVFNRALQAFAASHPKHVHYVDLGGKFLSQSASDVWTKANVNSNTDASARPSQQEINEMFMPDAQHPSSAGMRIIAAGLEPLVTRLVGEAEADMDTI